MCKVYLQARDDGVLLKSQEKFAKACDILIQGLATVGIIGLIDEVTGYQEERDREALHKILAAYISKELLPWAKMFPDEFYEQMFRLKGWQFRPLKNRGPRGPRLAGKLTKQIVYEKLPPGVLEELEKLNPPNENWRRKYRYPQLMTEKIGHPHLKNHLIAVITLMRASRTWREFEDNLERAFPSQDRSY